MENRTILLADDSGSDSELIIAALDSCQIGIEVDRVRDGVEVLDYLYRRGAWLERTEGQPVVVVLDLKMPRLSGFEVLSQVRVDPDLRSIPIVVFTSSAETRDIEAAYELGANAYVVKPLVFEDFESVVREIGRFWGLVNCTSRLHS